jgi:hypothetical protein
VWSDLLILPVVVLVAAAWRFAGPSPSRARSLLWQPRAVRPPGRGGGAATGIENAPATAGWRHQPSHRVLLGPLSPGPDTPTGPAAVDLVVVPTCRPDPHGRPGILTALDLARAGLAHNVLVILSKDATGASGVRELCRLLQQVPTGVGIWLCELGEGRETLPSFAVDRLPLTRAYRRFADGNPRAANEVGSKRNLALRAARALGLGNVLFLDDDISPSAPGPDAAVTTLDEVSVAKALHAISRDGGPSAVGWAARGYDDNSVVCRAAALAGMAQDQFIGGGALLVRVDSRTPFFPGVYNEDWLFLLAMLLSENEPGRLVREPTQTWLFAGEVRQEPYDGWKPRRARSEELGDVLGEGLMSLLHRGPEGWEDARQPRFWRSVIDGRREFIDRIRRSLADAPCSGDDLERAAAALDAAQTVHEQIDQRRRFWTDQLVRYLDALANDLATWSAALDGVRDDPFAGMTELYVRPPQPGRTVADHRPEETPGTQARELLDLTL